VGALNKSTLKVKEALEQTFEHLGGVQFMKEWASQEPTEFMKLYIKLLPVQVQADVRHDGVVSFVVETGIRRAPDEPVEEE